MTEGTYLGEDGLLHCSRCHEPKEAVFPPNVFPGILSRKHTIMCSCDKEAAEEKERKYQEEQHRFMVDRLTRECFGKQASRGRTFENSESDSQAMRICRDYAERWDTFRKKNLGLLLWGDVGTGKTNAAICIANALIEQEVPVRMMNLGQILNSGFEDKTRILEAIPDYALFILDDFGMERGTEYGQEIAFQVIDTRYRSGKPIIVTTNLTLWSMKSAKDLERLRIYDRIQEMCIPVHFVGTGRREAIQRQKMEFLTNLIKQDGGNAATQPV